MGWFAKTRRNIIPSNVWEKCKRCEEAIYRKDLEKNFWVCQKCDYHFALPNLDRINLLADEGTFEEFDAALASDDPLQFQGVVPYRERLKKSQAKTLVKEAITTGYAKICGLPVVLAVFNFDFMGGSMGSVVGEKIVRACENAIQRRHPFVLVSTSGGARMDEGILSLMQMIKTGMAVARLSMERIPFISFLADPTTGGVTASVAMLGDVILAEPGALIGFAGPRVIEQTIKQTLPKGFQRAEFLKEKGVIDMVVHRSQAKNTVGKILRFFA
ncbi:MAG: acetyl-CoA carboxylase carboxyltransferase subunit beta [Candidatus Riflebacteria bacterium]|nr:acetyl-CoA carboxylase carboxyltransferase subunit beta [Candidatus Riflebacteria bacterium]